MIKLANKVEGDRMVNNNTLVPGFNDEKDDSLKISLSKIEDVPNCVSIILNGYVYT